MLPEWLLLGLGGAVVAATATAAIFYVGLRRFPTAERPHKHDGERRRRGEIREYLTAIGESFAEDHSVAGQAVEFYLPKRDVAITFDARAYFRIDGSGTEAVLVEHELPGSALGSRLPFETPVSIGADLASDPERIAFAVLGVPTEATVADVEHAYREQLKEVHPDHGGDLEAFERVREAYTIAKKRAG